METHPLGQIVTFYSYKGGTGRTMALANIACLLGLDQGRKKGGADAGVPERVLALDWDLEAPGLHRYLRPYLSDVAASQFERVFTDSCG